MPKILIDDFSGGKNTLDHQLLILNNQCASATKNVWAPDGALQKTPGFVEYKNSTATGTTIHALKFDILSNTRYLFGIIGSGSGVQFWNIGPGDTDAPSPLGYVTGTVSISGASLISATGSGTSWNTQVTAGDYFRINATADKWIGVESVEDATHLTLTAALSTAIATGSSYTILKKLTPQDSWGMASLNGSFYVSNGTELVLRYDTTGTTSIAAFPKAFFLATHRNYMFAARTPTAESRLYWSAIKDPTSWPSNNFIDVDKDRGKITGIISYGNELVILKTYGVYKLIGETFDPSNPVYSVNTLVVPNEFLCNSGFFPIVHKNMLYLFALDGLYIYLHGTDTIQKYPYHFSNELVSGTDFGDPTSATAKAQFIKSASIQDFLMFGWERGGTEKSVGILDKNGSYWLITSTDAAGGTFLNNFTIARTNVGVLKFLASSDDSQARIFEIDVLPPTYSKSAVNTDTGATIGIDSNWTSKEFTIGYGTFKELVIYLEKQSAGNLSVDWSIDQASFVTNSVDMTTGRGNTIRKVLNINQTGSTIQLRLTNSVAAQTFKVFGIEIMYDSSETNRKV